MVQYWTCNKYIERIFVIFPLVLIIIVFGITVSQYILYSSINFQDLINLRGPIQYIQNQLQKNPIRRIQFTQESNCPQYYEKVNLYRWPGTRVGCYCSKQNIVTQYQQQQRCRLYDEVCELIGNQQQQVLQKWESRYICIQRVRDYYYQEQKYINQCRVGYIKCSQLLCVSDSEECPITYIIPSQQNSNNNNKEYIYISNTNKLDIYRESIFQPVIDILVWINSLPCLDTTLTQQQQQYSNIYPLIQQEYTGCGHYGTIYTNTKSLYSTNEYIFYTYNIDLDILNNLNLYSQYTQDSKAYLGYQIQLKLKYDNIICRHINLNNYYILIDSLQQLHYILFKYLLTGLISSGLLTIWTSLYLIYSSIKRDIQIGQQPIYLNILSILLDFYILAMCSHLHTYSHSYQTHRNIFDSYIDNSCFEEYIYTQIIFNVVNTIPSQLTALLILMDILFGISAAAFICFLIILITKYSLLKFRKTHLDYHDGNYLVLELPQAQQPKLNFIKSIPNTSQN